MHAERFKMKMGMCVCMDLVNCQLIALHGMTISSYATASNSILLLRAVTSGIRRKVGAQLQSPLKEPAA